VIDRILPGSRAADSDLHAREFTGPQGVEDRAHALVTSVAASRADPEFPERQVEIVVDHEQPGQLGSGVLQEEPHRDAAAVHVGLRQPEEHTIPTDTGLGNQTVAGSPPRRATPTRSEPLRYQKPHIVARLSITETRIPETDE